MTPGTEYLYDIVVNSLTSDVKYYRHVHGNELSAVMAWEAYVNECDRWDLSPHQPTFDRAFPEYATL